MKVLFRHLEKPFISSRSQTLAWVASCWITLRQIIKFVELYFALLATHYSGLEPWFWISALLDDNGHGQIYFLTRACFRPNGPEKRHHYRHKLERPKSSTVVICLVCPKPCQLVCLVGCTSSHQNTNHSIIGPAQNLDGRPLGKSWCCRHWFGHPCW